MDELHNYAEAERQKTISWAENQNGIEWKKFLEAKAKLAAAQAEADQWEQAELKALAWERRPLVHRRVLNPVQTLLAARN